MIALVLLTLPGCGLVAEQLGQPADPTDHAEIVFEVPKGATARGLGPLLVEDGLIDDASRFENYVRLTKEGGCLKAGLFRLRRDMSAHELLLALCGAPMPADVPFTVVEGWRIREIDAALAEAGLIEAGAYAALAGDPSHFSVPFPLPDDSLEGYLYPETYMVTPDRFEASAFIQRQLDLFTDRFYLPRSGDLEPRGLHAVVIMASLLEREEPRPDNRNMVAGILWKRLDAAWNLGVDATSRYTLAQWNDRKAFLAKLRDPEDPYNTRLRPGLPPTAIGNPGLPSLEAAIAPVDSEYWYYLHDAEQNLHPSRDAAEHERTRRKYNVY